MGSTIGTTDGLDGLDGVDGLDGLDGLSGVSLAVKASPRPIGVSPGLKKPFVGGKWPFDPDPQWPYAAPDGFPRGYWASANYAIPVVGEFVRAKCADGLTWDSPDLEQALRNILQSADTAAELRELAELMEYRAGVLAEALAQRTGLWSYWRGILMFDAWSHPRTCDLVEIAARVGQFQAMHYKRLFNRARPSQYSMELLPPIDVPGHASFPSGHATEANLLSLCLAQVMPAVASAPAKDKNKNTIPDSSPLQRMAQRVARNREVLGLHYPSDSAAGKLLAEQSFKLLLKCKTVTQLIAEAKLEWPQMPQAAAAPSRSKVKAV